MNFVIYTVTSLPVIFSHVIVEDAFTTEEQVAEVLRLNNLYVYIDAFSTQREAPFSLNEL